MTKGLVRRFRQSRIRVHLVIDPEQNSDAQESESDRNVSQSGEDERTTAPANVRRSQHSLHHVLVSSVRAHGDESRAEEAGKNRVFNSEHRDDFLPTMLRRIQPGGNEIVEMKTARTGDDFIPTARNGKVKQPNRDERAAEHD